MEGNGDNVSTLRNPAAENAMERVFDHLDYRTGELALICTRPVAGTMKNG